MTDSTFPFRMRVKARIAFANGLFDPYVDSATGRRSWKAIAVELAQKDVDAAWKLVDEHLRTTLGGKFTRRQLKQCFIHDGAEKAQYPGFEEGKPYFSLSSSSDRAFRVVDGTRRDITREDGIIYSGCHCLFIFDVYAQNKPGQGPQVNAALKGVQFLSDGEPFSGGSAVRDDEFETLEEEDDVFA